MNDMGTAETPPAKAATRTWESWIRATVTNGDGAADGAANLVDTLIKQAPANVWEQNWDPKEEDRCLAWELYTELRTRIATQPLHYLHGDEESALTSIADLFKLSRELMRKKGPQARHFATLTALMLNQVIRPFTAKWHKRKLAGAFEKEDDVHQFRKELQPLQQQL
ncbi:MAG: hypothetical protein ACKOUR_13000, partial [Planctomycetota bacterium]